MIVPDVLVGDGKPFVVLAGDVFFIGVTSEEIFLFEMLSVCPRLLLPFWRGVLVENFESFVVLGQFLLNSSFVHTSLWCQLFHLFAFR